jgi:protein-serine/threonine kinase
MQTSCGSPCYAAPELVISDGMYVGSAVDIWSCGVILYAMLAGYLPFDDDPANPDGDNINLLYKYIVNTPLSFPDYISIEARDLLSLMLVPDPKKRADIQTVMNHRWLRPSAALFGRTLPDLEHAAMEQHQQKRLAYQKQMKAAAAAENQRMARSQSARTDGYANSVGVLPSSTTRSRSHRDYSQQQQVPLYETSNDQSVYTSSPSQQQVNATVPTRKGATSQIVLPTTAPLGVDDDPFAQAPSREKPETDLVISPVSDGLVDENARRRLDSVSKNDATPTSKTANGTRKASNAAGPPQDQGQRKKKDDFRHTIQVEYNDNATSESQQLSQSQSSHRQPSQEKQQPIYPIKASEARTNGTRRVSQSKNDTTPKKPASQTTSSPSTPTASDIPKIKALPPTPQNNTPRPRATSRGYTAPPDPTSSQTTQPTIEVTAPLSPTSAQPETNGVSDLNISVNGTRSKSAKTHRTGPSLDKIGFSKFFGTRSTPDQTNGTTKSTVSGPTTMSSRQTSESDAPSDTGGSTRPRRPSTMQVTPTLTSQSENTLSKPQSSTSSTQNTGGRSPQLLSPVNSSSASATSSKKNRRNTLTVMVEPFSRSIKQRTKSGRGSSRESSSKEKDSVRDKAKSREPSDSILNQDAPKTAVLPPHQHQDAKFSGVARPGVGNAASTSKAKKVMEWFRTKSRGKVPDEEQPVNEKTIPTPSSREVPLNASTSTINGLNSPSMTVHPPTVNPDASTPRSNVPAAPGHSNRTPSIATDKSASNPIKRSFILSPAAKNILRVHHGAMDQTTITSGNPPEVMKHVLDVLVEMGLEVQEESLYKYRCIRPKKRKIGSTGVSLKDGQGGSGLAAFTMVGSAASGGVSVHE